MHHTDRSNLQTGALTASRRRLSGATALGGLVGAASLALLVLVAATPTMAQTIQWNGGDGNWTDTSKWTDNTNAHRLPTQTDNPTVIQAPGTVTLGTAADAGRLQVLGGGNLLVSGGGKLTTGYLSTIGLAPSLVTAPVTATATSGTGSMTVTGAGSVWDAQTFGVRVGNTAAGTLTIANGGLLTMADGLLSVGLNAGGNGTLIVDNGSIVNGKAALRAGYNGATGTVTVSNGGKLTTSNVNQIGQTDAAGAGTGIVNVTGAGSEWRITAGVSGGEGELFVGNGAGAKGTVNVTAGGKLIMDNPTMGYGGLRFGLAGGDGTLLVSGTGSLVDAQAGLTLGDGTGSTATMTVTDNALAQVKRHNVIVGYRTGTGTLNITNGGSLTSESSVYIGNENGTGTLNVNSGGKLTVTAGAMDIGAGGNATATIDGAGTTVTTRDGFSVGYLSTATLTVSNGAVMSSTNGGLLIGNGVGPTVANGTGTVNVLSGAKISVGGSVDVGFGSGTTGTATLNVIGTGSRVDAARLAIGNDVGFGASTGTVTVAEGGAIKATEIVVGFNPGGHGTLNIGSGGAAGTVEGKIRLAGAEAVVNFNHNQANYTFGSAITDWWAPTNLTAASGAINFLGTGTTTLTEVSDYSLATNVNAGKLIVAEGGSIANSVLTTVKSGAALGGAGTVGNVSVQSGGIIAPTGLKTLTVKDIAFANGSIYQVGIDTTGASGKIAADHATLNGGNVQIMAGAGNYSVGQRYTVLTASSGVTGQFSGVASDLAFLTAALDYSNANKVDLTLGRNGTTFVSVATTANQRGVAAAVEALGAANGVYGAVVQQNTAGARAAYDQLSGEAHASGQVALIGVANVVGDTLNSRLTQAFDVVGTSAAAGPALGYADEAMPGLGYAKVDKKTIGKDIPMVTKAPVPVIPVAPVYATWAEGLGNWLHRSSDDNAGSMDSQTGGVMAGMDATLVGAWRFGVATGFSHTKTDVDGRNASEDADSYHIAAYGGARDRNFGLNFGASYTWHKAESERSVSIGGLAERLTGEYDASTAQVFGEANYRFDIGPAALVPFAGISYVAHSADGYAEHGGVTALTYGDSDYGTAFTTLGARLSGVIGSGDGYDVIGRGSLAWRHAFGDTDTGATVAFVGGNAFSVAGLPMATDTALMQAGIDVRTRSNLTLGLSWTGQAGGDTLENRLQGKVLYRW